MDRYLIIDIESYLYKSITYCKKLIQDKTNKYIFYEGYDISKAENYIAETIDRLCKTLNANDFELVVGDKNNFRKQINPEYKAQRPPKPEIYYHIYNMVKDKYGFTSLANLEADDTCRIIYEDNNYLPYKDKIIVSIDKDFFTVPCKFYRDIPNTKDIVMIDIDTANYNLNKQVIMGDTADNYKGIPNYGEVKASKFLEFSRDEKELIKLFEDNGLTKQDYLNNLYMARLIGVDRYNINTGEVYYDK